MIVACGASPTAPPASPAATRLVAASTDAGLDSATPPGSGPTDTPSGSTATPEPSHLTIVVLPWHLDVGLSRAVAFADQGSLVVAGGLTPKGTTSEVRRIDVATGVISDVGHLRRPAHDASGAVIGGRLLVFGGGQSVASAAVQVVSPGTTGQVIGSLPAARADLSTAVVGDHVFVIGGGSAN
jgi:hypothetical protein